MRFLRPILLWCCVLGSLPLVGYMKMYSPMDLLSKSDGHVNTNHNRIAKTALEPPIANDDSAVGDEDNTVTINILDNDVFSSVPIDISTVDLDVTTLAIDQSVNTAEGLWTVSSGGVVTFTPLTNYYGPAEIKYTVANLDGERSNIATISVTINAVNDAPVANPDNATTNQNVPVTIHVVSNDIDVDGSIDITSIDLNQVDGGVQSNITTEHGVWSANSGQVTFEPYPTVTGVVTLTYTVNDNQGLTSNQATITVNVVPVNSAPIAVADVVTTNEDETVHFSVVANDTDADGSIDPTTVDLDPTTATQDVTYQVSNGTFSVNAAGVVTFQPLLNFYGQLVISYTVKDNSGAVSNPASITVNVLSVNDPPVAVADNITTNEDVSVLIDVLANDDDVDDGIVNSSIDLNTATIGIETTHSTTEGLWEVVGTQVRFTPVLNFNGQATLQYTIRDLAGAVSNAALISVTVTPVNDPPVAISDAATTTKGVAVDIQILANDTDVDSDIIVTTVDLDLTTSGVQNTRVNEFGNWVVTNGILRYTPLANFSGVATVTYRVSDEEGAVSNTATVTVTVEDTNDSPVAVNDAITVSEDNSISISILSNDSDSDGSLVTSSVDLQPTVDGIQKSYQTTHGLFEVNASGVVLFTPTLNFNGVVTAQYTVNDNQGASSNIATITVTVTAVNDAPVAVNDNFSTQEDTPITYNITANDTDVDSDLKLNSIDLNPSASGVQKAYSDNGNTLTVDDNGIVTFTPAANYSGTFTANYTITDIEGAISNVATITITVVEVNDPPVAQNDVATADQGQTITISILNNDVDADGTINPATVDLNPAQPGIQSSITVTGGQFSVNSSGIVTFVADGSFSGIAIAQYVVSDNDGAFSNVASINVTVNSVNHAPIARNDSTSTNEDVSVSFNVLQNDTDSDGSINATTVDLNPSSPGIQNFFNTANGNFTVNTSGVVTFIPAPNYFGVVIVSYTVEDNVGATSNIATLKITVNPVNDLPVAVNDEATTQEGQAVTINILANDSDIDGILDPNTVDINKTMGGTQKIHETAEGKWEVNNLGVVTFTPAAQFHGVAQINYTVQDNQSGTSNEATIKVTVIFVNDAPVAVADEIVTNEDTPVTYAILANDSDVDGTLDITTIDLNTTLPGIQKTVTRTEGELSIQPDGTLRYVPTLNYHGTFSIAYTVRDNNGLSSNVALITIVVNSVNDAPVALNDNVTINKNTVATIPVLSNDSDVDGTLNLASVDLNEFTAGIQSSYTTTEGLWEVSTEGIVKFTPVQNFVGTASLRYSVSDNEGLASNLATITVTVLHVNAAPVAQDDAVSTNEDTVISFNIVENDSDDGGLVLTTIDLDVLTPGIQNSRTVAGGIFSVNPSGIVTFTPTLNYNGIVSIRYTINDNEGATSNMATITVTVVSVNDAPVAVNDEVSMLEDQSVTINVLANDSDVDGTLDKSSVDLIVTTAEIEKTNQVPNGTFTVNSEGIVTFTPNANYAGTVTSRYRVKDNDGAWSNDATITVHVTPVNDPPTLDVIPNQRVLRNAEQKSITLTGISAGPNETGDVLLSAVSSNTTLIPLTNLSITHNNTSATAILKFQPAPNQTGTTTISVRAIDTGFSEVVRSFTVEVVDVRITSAPIAVAVENELYEYNLSVTNVDETLTLAVTQKPAWLTLTSTGKNSAKLSGTPTSSASGGNVVVQLRNGSVVVDEQSYTVSVNHRPSLSSFNISLNEDQPYQFSLAEFDNAFQDVDQQALSEIQFSSLPKHGTVQLNSVVLTTSSKIARSSIQNLRYVPSTDYTGLDTLYWLGSDPYHYSLFPAYISIVINPVNDPPNVSLINTDTLLYEVSSEIPVQLVNVFEITDVDDDDIVGATLTFRTEDYVRYSDKLEFKNTDKISGSFSSTTGQLILSGVASKEEYVQAIKSVQYLYDNARRLEFVNKVVFFQLNDGKSLGDFASRHIKLIDTFQPLDIPNSFTPDGNGKNDYWVIGIKNSDDDDDVLRYEDTSIKVYDRRGHLVFETVGFDTPWDGRSKTGEKLPVDSYFYTIEVKSFKVSYKGVVTILR
jgi:gliding motility-associated-like protein